MKTKTHFVAGNHGLHFGKYKGYKAIDIARQDPVYMRWCIDTLKQIKFADRIKRATNKYLKDINGHSSNLHR